MNANVIYDSETDTLTCYSCKKLIEADEPKILVGFINPDDTQDYAAYHPACVDRG